MTSAHTLGRRVIGGGVIYEMYMYMTAYRTSVFLFFLYVPSACV